MENIFLEKSMFLCEHRGIQEFAKKFSVLFQKDTSTQWSIVCERKEDLITVRNQVFFEIQKNREPMQSAQALIGISMYTIDNLARNFCATLSASQDKKIINEMPSFIAKPYLDVISQESMVETILNCIGYIGSDSLPIAKQILSLIDASLPHGMDFAQLLISTQEKDNIKTVQEITEISLKQMLACYQYSKQELKNYSRLQALVTEYLQGTFIDHLYNYGNKKSLELPNKFLKGHILWISAPEFTFQNINLLEKNKNILTQSTLKPGNFQSIFVDEFKNSIIKAKKILNYEQNEFITSRTIIAEDKDNLVSNKEHIKYFVSENKHCYFTETKKIINKKNVICLLADFNPGNFKEIRPDAQGSYAISQKSIEEWNKGNDKFTDATEIYQQLDMLFEKFIDKISLIGNKENLIKFAKLYSLETKLNNENFLIQLFYNYAEKECVMLGESHPMQECPRALSFIATEKFPEKIVAIGRAHAPTGSSFHVKVLNNAISLLKKQGVTIDLPASETMYRGFWKNIINQNIPVEFWLDNPSELNNFPKYLLPKNNILKLGIPLPIIKGSHLLDRIKNTGNFLIPQWKNYFSSQKNGYSITEFERYIACPLQYFLSDILGIKKEIKNNLNIDHMNIGTQIHLIAEQLITRLVTIIGNKEYGKIMLPIYINILNELKKEENFLSLEKNKWNSFICKSIKESTKILTNEIQNAFFEAIENLWFIDQIQNKTKFTLTQERETVKRTFLRFLQIEKTLAESLDNQSTGIERERPISLKLGGLNFYGKIDRIDSTKDGLRIIDYKTSKIPKNEKTLALLPSELSTKQNIKLSAQGALYCLAWAQNKLLKEEENSVLGKIKSFSLYRLKNLDENTNPILTYELTSPIEKNSFFYSLIEKEYSSYATKLKQGNFTPNPLQPSTCDYCSYNNLCPLLLNSNKENEVLGEE